MAWRAALHVGCKHHIEDALLPAEHLLLNVQDLQVGRHAVEARGGEELEEGGLADAVSSHEAVLAPEDNREVGVFEKLPPRHLHLRLLEQDVARTAAAALAGGAGRREIVAGRLSQGDCHKEGRGP